MAFTAREVILVFRGQNYLSSAIRRVSGDVQGLSRMQQLQMRKAAMVSQQARIAASKRAAEAERRSFEVGGQRHVSLLKAQEQHVQNLASMRQAGARLENTIESSRLARQAALMKYIGQRQLRLKAIADFEAKGETASANFQRMNLAHEKDMMQLARDRYRVNLQGRGVLQNAYNIEAVRGAEALTARTKAFNAAQERANDAVTHFGAEEAMARIRMAQVDAMIRTTVLRRWLNFARIVEHVGRVIQMFGLIGTATFGFFATQWAKFQSDITVAATQTTVAGQNTVAQVQKNSKQIGDAITDLLMSGKTLAKPDELTKSVYDIFSGVTLKGNQQEQLKQGISLLKQFNEVVTANAGIVDLNAVTQAGITLINDFGYSIEQMPKALNLMQASVRYGRMNMEQFLSTFNQAAPAAKSAGYSFDEMATSITFLSRKFPSIRFAATGYARLLDIIGRSRDAFKEQGIAIQDSSGKLLPLETIIKNIAKRYPEAVTGAKNFSSVLKEITGQTGTMQAARVATFLIQDPEGFRTIIKQVTGDTNELRKSLTAAEQSTGVRWEEFLNQLRGIVLVIGEGAVPAFSRLGKPVANLVNWFRDLDPRWQKLIGYVGTFAAAGALLTGVLSSIVGGMAAIALSITIWFRMRAAMRLATAALAEFVGEERAAAIAGGGMGGQRGSVMVGTAMKMSLISAIPFIILYRKEIMNAIQATGGWQQAVIAVGGALTALKLAGWMTALARMGPVAVGLAGTAGLLGLVAVLKDVGGSSEIARRGLDAMFSGWGGYLASIAVLTVAVNKLKQASIALMATQGIQAFLTRGRVAAGAQVATRTGEMGIATGMAAFGGGQLVRSAETGKIIGATAATKGLAAAFTGLGAAVTSFLPAVAVGGALLGGLYLWKRHLDSVHAAQERVRRAQQYITTLTTNDPALAQFRQFPSVYTDNARAALSYAGAQKALNDAIKAGVTGAELAQLKINFQDAALSLDSTQTALRGVNKAFNDLQFTRGQKSIDTARTAIKDLKWALTNWQGFGAGKFAGAGGMVSGAISDADLARLNHIKETFNIDDINDLKNRIDMFEAKLLTGSENLAKSTNKFRKAGRDVVTTLIKMGILPKMTKPVIDALVEWMLTLNKLPTLDEMASKAAALAMFGTMPPPGKQNAKQWKAWATEWSSAVDTIITAQQKTDAAAQKAKSARGKTDPTGGGRKTGATQAQIDARMIKQAAEIARLHARASQSGSTTDWRNYYNTLNKYQKQYKDTNLDVFNAILDQQESRLKDSATKQKTITTQTFDDILNASKGMLDTFVSQESNIWGELFQGPLMQSAAMQNIQQYGGKATGKDLLNDIVKQNAAFKERENVLDRLRKRGLSPDVIAQIRSMGPAGIDTARALLQLSPADIKKYSDQYVKGQRMIHNQSLLDLKNKLKDYQRFGRQVALAIIAGLRSENVTMENALRNLIQKMFPGLPIGETGAGGKSTHTAPKGKATGNNVTVSHNYTVQVKDGADIRTQVAHADIVARNKYGTGQGPTPTFI